MGGGSCSVCKEAPPKYKCPSCRTPYTKKNLARRYCFRKKLASHCRRRKFHGALRWWKMEQSALMRRINIPLYWS
nr:unnamed protein product [Digitaria exilis]